MSDLREVKLKHSSRLLRNVNDPKQPPPSPVPPPVPPTPAPDRPARRPSPPSRRSGPRRTRPNSDRHSATASAGIRSSADRAAASSGVVWNSAGTPNRNARYCAGPRAVRSAVRSGAASSRRAQAASRGAAGDFFRRPNTSRIADAASRSGDEREQPAPWTASGAGGSGGVGSMSVGGRSDSGRRILDRRRHLDDRQQILFPGDGQVAAASGPDRQRAEAILRLAGDQRREAVDLRPALAAVRQHFAERQAVLADPPQVRPWSDSGFGGVTLERARALDRQRQLDFAGQADRVGVERARRLDQRWPGRRC